MKTVVIKIEGMSCNACKTLIEDVSREVTGIKSCVVNFQTGEAVINYNENYSLNVLKNEIEALGKYKVIIS